jgi:hypothetical protein
VNADQRAQRHGAGVAYDSVAGRVRPWATISPASRRCSCSRQVSKCGTAMPVAAPDGVGSGLELHVVGGPVNLGWPRRSRRKSQRRRHHDAGCARVGIGEAPDLRAASRSRAARSRSPPPAPNTATSTRPCS